jgi:hypothetical protein
MCIGRALDKADIQESCGFWRTHGSTDVDVMEMKCHGCFGVSSGSRNSLLGPDLPRQVQRQYQ